MSKGSIHTYFSNIKEAVSTSLGGAALTWQHFIKAMTKESRKPVHTSHEDYFKKYDEGIFTLQYPKEKFPVPDNGRYKLDIVMDDCIVCDKCAKICPVDCIDIEAIKSTEVIGHTSDGTAKRLYPAVFDIDMAKCLYCGLCTAVCPTECLTMTKEYDYSTFNLNELKFEFSEMSEEEVEEKKKAYEEAQANKMKKHLASNS
ncbi:4Fe-4S dicluster domain-containing protein [Algivirga pacifica]|uniref:4Fe-4S binding protein n=1 Tax=Algivirga pacifica TaxID=1162670 RepID=A0ABP9DP30_9BACT